jgi:hypothetical protein
VRGGGGMGTASPRALGGGQRGRGGGGVGKYTRGTEGGRVVGGGGGGRGVVERGFIRGAGGGGGAEVEEKEEEEWLYPLLVRGLAALFDVRDRDAQVRDCCSVLLTKPLCC